MRRTNLFYTNGPESKFLTFSNYTEAMTGNFLSTDTKMFPSYFICFKLDNIKKDRFIFFLGDYYENKLATLRDNNVKTNPLFMLFNAIDKYCTENNVSKSNYYISKITEQDYNGQYSDMIFNVDLDSLQVLVLTDFSSDNQVKVDDTFLHGWEHSNAPSDWLTQLPIFDDKNEKYYNSDVKYKCYISNFIENSISFNVIIPLFTVSNLKDNANINTDFIADDSHNVPLGIWFSDNNCEPIELKKDVDTQYSPSWSLTLSAQFKPFPSSGSKLLVNESNNTLNTSSFTTFAQVLIKQNELMEQLTNLSSQYIDVLNRLNNIETQLKNVKTDNNLDDINIRLSNIEKRL